MKIQDFIRLRIVISALSACGLAIFIEARYGFGRHVTEYLLTSPLTIVAGLLTKLFLHRNRVMPDPEIASGRDSTMFKMTIGLMVCLFIVGIATIELSREFNSQSGTILIICSVYLGNALGDLILSRR